MIVRTSLYWALVLGLTGFAAGFFGPMLINPEANIGPLVGLLFTGPGGAVGGLVLGALVGASSMAAATRRAALIAAGSTLALGTLWYCPPEPAVRGYVIDAQVEACEPLESRIDDALAEWNKAVARVTWAKPPADWRETAARNVRADTGQLVAVRIERKRAIYRHRRPWDRDRPTAGPWLAAGESARYYVAAGTCESYREKGRALYWPSVDDEAARMQPSAIWPPTDTLGFLRLQTLDPVPVTYRALVN